MASAHACHDAEEPALDNSPTIPHMRSSSDFLVTDGTPIRDCRGKIDTFQAGVLHHLPYLTGGETLFQVGAKTVQSIGAHRVKAALAISRERNGGDVNP